MSVVFLKPEERYIRSYWETFGDICREGIYLALSEPFPYKSTVEFMKNMISDGAPSLFVIDDESDRCVGWCDAISEDGINGRLGMGLAEPYRNRGYGTELLKRVIELSREYGYKYLFLEVWKTNGRAVHLYEKAGFGTYDEDDKKLYMKLKLDK